MVEPKKILLNRVEELLEIERRFNVTFGSHPIPTWIKFLAENNRLVMGLVNSAYTRATGISITAYMGKPDDAVWTSGEHEEFGKTDSLVVKTGTAHRVAEKAIHPITKKSQYWIGWKWPYVHHEAIVGVVGCAESVSEEFWNQYGADLLIALGEN
jgi:hypothetical protein